jgi:hypothetical protein
VVRCAFNSIGIPEALSNLEVIPPCFIALQIN